MGDHCMMNNMKKATKTKVEFYTFLDKADTKGRIRLVSIGKAKNTVKKPTLTGWKDLVTEIVLDKRYTKGL